MRLRFGDSIDVAREFIIDRATPDSREDIVNALNEQLYDILCASNEHRTSEIDLTSGNEILFDNIKPGDYVLATYPNGPPTKLHSLYRGPLIVLESIRNEGFLCQDIITQTQLEISKDRIKLFRVPEGYPANAITTLAAHDHDEFWVDKILDHRGDPKKKSSLEFLVSWKGYDSSENTWEPWKNVRKLTALDEYLEQHPALKLK
jgi:hypothetical protein